MEKKPLIKEEKPELGERENKPDVCIATSISNLEKVARLNVILWGTYVDVRYLTNKVKGRQRVVLISDDFETTEGDWVRSGRAFFVTEILRGTEVGIHILVYPDVSDRAPADAKDLHWHLSQKFNRESIEAAYQSIPDDAKFTPVSFWRYKVGKEWNGFVEVRKPSATTYTFAPTDDKYVPVVGTEELMDDNMKRLFNLLATSRTHPAFKAFEAQPI